MGVPSTRSPAYDYSKLPPATTHASSTSSEAPIAPSALMHEVEDSQLSSSGHPSSSRDPGPPLPSATLGPYAFEPKAMPQAFFPTPTSASISTPTTDSLSTSSSGSVLSLRRPAAPRDVAYVLAYVAHTMLLLGALAALPDKDDDTDGGVGVGVGWLFGVVLCGLLVSLSVGTRGQWARYGSTLLAWAPRGSCVCMISLALATLLRTNTRPTLVWAVVLCVLGVGVSDGLWDVRKGKQQRDFAATLTGMCNEELLGSSPRLPLFVNTTLALQALFLWWWGWLVGAHVGRAWGLLGALLALNYYWTTQLCRAVVQCVVCGVATRWFHGDCPFLGDEEEGHHEYQGQARPNATLPTTEEDDDLVSEVSDHVPSPTKHTPHSSTTSLNTPPLPNQVLLHHVHCALSVSLGSLCRGALWSPLAHVLWAAQHYDATHARHVGPLRRFIRGHHPLSLCHVGVYKKGFGACARDTWNLLLASGLDLVLRRDTTHRSLRCVVTCASSLVSLCVVLLSGPTPSLLLRAALAFAITYAQVSLCLQPLVGGVHGTLLCFAQWPSLVSQTFPLIFHRLIRTAEARNF